MRVKLTTQHPGFPVLRQTPGGTGRWGETTFLLDDDGDPYDWWVVAEGLLRTERVRCPPENVVLLTWEPPSRPAYRQAFIDQFATVVTCHQGLVHPHVVLEQQGLPWFVGRSYDELVVDEPIAKTRDLSIVTSNKVFTEGHMTRLRLAHALKEHFGERADLFGRGIRDFDDKWDVLAPYRYTVAVENDLEPFYVSEKLTDCFLARCIPFYAGAPNTDRWFPADSFIPIDPSDIAGTVRRIEDTLGDAHDEAIRSAAMAQARRRALDVEQLFPMLDRVLRSLADGRPIGPTTTVTLRPEVKPPSVVRRGAGRLARRVRLQ